MIGGLLAQDLVSKHGVTISRMEAVGTVKERLVIRGIFRRPLRAVSRGQKKGKRGQESAEAVAS